MHAHEEEVEGSIAEATGRSSSSVDLGGCVLAAELGALALWPGDGGRKAGEKRRERGTGLAWLDLITGAMRLWKGPHSTGINRQQREARQR